MVFSQKEEKNGPQPDSSIYQYRIFYNQVGFLKLKLRHVQWVVKLIEYI